jgi:DNA-binding GntR family transcriptional regulator
MGNSAHSPVSSLNLFSTQSGAVGSHSQSGKDMEYREHQTLPTRFFTLSCFSVDIVDSLVYQTVNNASKASNVIMTKREYIYGKIRDAITYGEFKPGERLVERSLSETFEVGRGPLREALSQLTIEGYLESHPNKSLIVAKTSVEDVRQIYSVIAVLEGHAAKAAARAVDKRSLEALHSIHKRLKEAKGSKDPKKWLEENTVFHESVVKLSGNRVLQSLTKGLRDRIYRYRSVSTSLAGVLDNSFRMHADILEALSNNDGIRAGRLMEKHILDVADKTISILERLSVL